MPHPEGLDQIEWKIKNIYDSCMSETVETEENRPLKKEITKLGGWRVLREFSLQTWDMKKTLRELHSKYNIQPFFRIDVVPDATQPQLSIIQISPGSLGLPDKTYYYRRAEDKIIQAYKRFLMDVVMTLGATSDDASTFSDDLFGFEKRLAERFPTRLPDRPGRYRPTIAKLEEIAPSVPFFDILSSLFPAARLTKKSEVVVVASDHLVNVSRIIASTDRSVLNDYMMWRLATGYLPYLSKKYRNTVTEFHKHLYGFREPMPRWEVCIETLQKFMGFGLEALIENSHRENDRKCKVVYDMFDQIKASIKSAIETSNNLPSHIQEHFLDKINSVGIQIGLSIPMRHPTYYNSFYSSLSTIKDDYFKNVLFGVNFLIDEQQKRLNAPFDNDRWIDIVSDGSLNVAYVPEVNMVIIPLALLSMPYFHIHFPWSVLYGGIGSEIGVAVLSSITGRGLFHSGDGTLLTSDHPVCNITHECFLHHPQATPYLEATKYTFQALENVLEKLPHSHQPALEYLEDEAIFFIAYAQV
ncbi:hypothetical protein AAG570_009303 [Ranatra chinensis]|uniref:Peptidase M13 N-terminal domain-containing protein n=1 Tax=Ranatra chinensis TaxID=642074 RepID=A0ABD0YZL5_9HEMI